MPNNMNMRNMALNLLAQNPNIANNPNAQEFIKVIQNGDSVKGAQIAQNLCETYGISKEDAIKNAKSFFNLPL
jgi:hypothetical protein